MDNILEINDLNVSFRTDKGRLRAARGVSLTLARGDTLAIVGESGSGKSVTSKAILGILPPNASVDSGSILFEGNDLLAFSERQMCDIRGKRISMIFQDPFSSLDPIVRVGRQLCEGMMLCGLSRKQAKDRAISLLREVGIPYPEQAQSRYPFEFSGGQRQRIVTAIALSGDPDLLICDEPTTALDVTIQAQILELIGKLKAERKLSVIFITHDLGVVAGVADFIAVMYAGKIVEYGRSEEIFCEPKHPYTRALLASTPDLETNERLQAIPGSPPDLTSDIVGDAFAPRNKYALKIDYELEPPIFWVSDTHYARTWLLHPKAPEADMPDILRDRIKRMQSNRHKLGK